MKSLKEKVRKASLHFRERASASASPVPGDGAAGSFGDEPYTVVDAQGEERSLSGEDESYVEPETLQTLTQLIRQFSELMNGLLSKMACDEPAAGRKEACLDILRNVHDCVGKTARESQLNWDKTVMPCALRLTALVEGWDAAAAAAPRSPDGFSEAADALLKTYTSNISQFLNSSVANEDDEGDAEVAAAHAPEDPNDGLRERLQEVLSERPDGVGSLLSHAKKWSKYLKEVISFMEKRAALEVEFGKKMAALVKATAESLEEYKEYACATSSISPLLKSYGQIANRDITLFSGPSHFLHVHPLDEFRIQHERLRKQLKDNWTRECRRLVDAVSVLQRSKARYLQLCQEWEKTLSQRQKEELSKYKLKLDKRAKEEGDVRSKLDEARKAYDQAVKTANAALADVGALKGTLINNLLDSLFQGGEVLRDVLICYQQDELTAVAPSLQELERNTELSRNDGASQAALQQADPQAEAFQMLPPFVFEAHELGGEVAEYLTQVGEANRCVDPVTASSILDSSMAAPKRVQEPYPVGLHTFVKHTIPSKCRHCRHACYFHAVSCMQCGVVCHKRCTELLQVRCKQASVPPSQRRASTVFGSPLAAQFRELEDGVPIIVRRIIQSIERRGLTQEGLYRIGGVKSHVEQVCADFENNPWAVDVDKEEVNVLTAVLKLYFRQLPEPVVPTAVAPRFLQIAKDLHGHKSDDSYVRAAVERTRQLVEELPKVNHDTLAYTIIHLARISEHCEVNKMKPSNLGIVFGPTLLRNETDTLDTLMDMPHQTIMAELMIEHYGTVFLRYLQEHNLVYTETPAMRRVRRPRAVEPLYASVSDVVAEMSTLPSPSPAQPIPIRLDAAADEGPVSISPRIDTPLRAAPLPPSHSASSPSLRSPHSTPFNRRAQSQDGGVSPAAGVVPSAGRTSTGGAAAAAAAVGASSTSLATTASASVFASAADGASGSATGGLGSGLGAAVEGGRGAALQEQPESSDEEETSGDTSGLGPHMLELEHGEV